MIPSDAKSLRLCEKCNRVPIRNSECLDCLRAIIDDGFEDATLMRKVLKSVLPYLHIGTVFGNITEARHSVEIALGMREP